MMASLAMAVTVLPPGHSSSPPNPGDLILFLQIHRCSEVGSSIDSLGAELLFNSQNLVQLGQSLGSSLKHG